MAPIFLDPGLLRHRLRLEEPVLAPDGAGGGGADRTWREVREVSAHIEPISAERRTRFGQHAETVTHRVICRHAQAIRGGMAFRRGPRRLLVRTVLDPDESGRYLVCRCEESETEASG